MAIDWDEVRGFIATPKLACPFCSTVVHIERMSARVRDWHGGERDKVMADPKSLDGWLGLGQVILDELSALRREVAELKALASARVVLLQEHVPVDDEDEEPEAFLTEDDVVGLRRALVSLADDTETLDVRVTPDGAVFGLLPEEMFDIICEGVSAWLVEPEVVLPAGDEPTADQWDELAQCVAERARRSVHANPCTHCGRGQGEEHEDDCPNRSTAYPDEVLGGLISVGPTMTEFNTAQVPEKMQVEWSDPETDHDAPCELCNARSEPGCGKNGLDHLCRKCADGLP